MFPFPPIPPFGKVLGTMIELGKKYLIPAIESLFSSDERKEKARKVAEQPAFNKEAKSPNENLELLNALSNLKNNIKERAEKLEDTYIDILEKSFEPLIEKLENENINARSIERAISISSSRIRHIFTSEIASNISIDNAKCVQILERNGVEGKTEALNNLCDDVLKNAIEKIKKEVSEGFINAKMAIQDILESKIAMQSNLITHNITALSELQQHSDKDSKERAQIQIAVNIARSEAMLCELATH